MVKKPLVVVAIVVFTVSAAGNAYAQAKEKSSFLPNPFARKSSGQSAKDDKASGVARDKGHSRSRFVLPPLPKPALPQLKLPSWKMPQRSPKKGPSAWEKMRNGTKQFFLRSKETLMPWSADDGGKEKLRSQRVSRTPAGGKKGGAESGVISTLFPGGAEEDRIETVNDFLSLPTARYQ